MNEAEAVRLRPAIPDEISARSLKQRERSDDIGLHKDVGAGNGTVNVAFRGQMHDCIGLILGENPVDGVTIANVMLLEKKTRIRRDRPQRHHVARVSHPVENDDIVIQFSNEMTTDRRANEPRAARDNDPLAHVLTLQGFNAPRL